jgi:hypothetical protein
MNEDGLEYPGIGRLHYFLGHLGMIAAVVFVVTVFGPRSPVMSVTTVLIMVAGLVLDVLRLRNIGVSQWFVFVRYLPFGSTALILALLCAQTGWAGTRRLDSAGKSILLAEIILIALMLFLMLRTGIELFGIAGNGIQVF